MTSIRCAPHIIITNPSMISNAFDTTSVVLNAVLATMIGGRILRAQKDMTILNEQAQYQITTRYLTTIGIMVESAFAWTLFGLLFTVARSMNSPSHIIFGALFELSGVSLHFFSSSKDLYLTDPLKFAGTESSAGYFPDPPQHSSLSGDRGNFDHTDVYNANLGLPILSNLELQ
jgi:hypothetical protein